MAQSPPPPKKKITPLPRQYVRLTKNLFLNDICNDIRLTLRLYSQLLWSQPGASFQLFLGGPTFFFICQCHRTIEKLKKQHFICSNLTLFIVPFFSLFFSFLPLFSFFLFFLFFSFYLGGGGDGPQPPK